MKHCGTQLRDCCSLPSPFSASTFWRTSSTEQCAREATAADTLPKTKRSKRLLNPVEPRKIQSALQSSATFGSSFFGLPSLNMFVIFSADGPNNCLLYTSPSPRDS